MHRSRIIGTGSYLPERVLTNHELESMVDTTDAWIRGRTGIAERRIAAADEFTLDLAEAAAFQAMAAAGIAGGELDLIVVATTTPDRVFPSTACLLQSRLRANGCAAFDIQAVCTGFVYALSVADQYIRTGMANRALVVGAETFSRIIDWTDRNTCVLFGDGAGAVVLEATDTPGILSTHIHADGDHAELLHVPAGVSNNLAAVTEGRAFVEMSGSEVFRVAVRTLGRIVDETLGANGVERADIDWLVPHQANLRIIAATAKQLALPMDKVVQTVAEHGNTSAASIPLALDTAVRDGRIQPGDLLLLEGFGGGFTWGSALIRW
ncbi:MAG: 3-oxoacyl-ACP synthase [Gammaproteobacteria bacterium]|nr:MAG: 3-oxoacyl-ACP synthase [Gammaproteobacteria bacterium]PIE36615.1 MAG: 3-oxoacyl-ACP synthase [Gammaproteobacteria bacterium]